MKELSEKHKEKYQEQVNKINVKDETKVKNRIQKEIDLLKKKDNSKLKGLIEKAELLASMLENHDFPISATSKNWIIFGLNYLISDVDLIPDSIPGIGYADDNMILNWVIKVVKQDIERFDDFINAKNTKEPLLKNIIQGDGDTQLVFFPGFFDSKSESYNNDWLKLLSSIKTNNSSIGISIFDWELKYLKELNLTLPIIDHKLELKPRYDTDAFANEWQQLKIDMKNLGRKLSVELYNIRKANPNKEIVAICLNTGSNALFTALEMTTRKLVDRIYLFGATCSEKRFIKVIGNKGIGVHNFFSENDHALRFIYDNYEHQHTPIGLGELHSLKTTGVINIDVSKTITRHLDYRYKFADLMNTID